MRRTISVIVTSCLAVLAGGTSARAAVADGLSEELLVPGVVGERFEGDLGEIRKRGVHAAPAIVGQETVRYVGNIYKYYVIYKLVLAAGERRKRTIEQMKQPMS